MEFEEEVVLLVLVHKKVKKKKKKKKFWIHLVLNSRQEQGIFYAVFSILRSNKSKFFNYFHMSVGSFDELLHYIKNDAAVSDTNMRCVPPEELLTVTLQEVQINSLYIFASSFTVFVPSSKCVTDKVIDGLFSISCIC